jgi:hypothetical protein
LYVLIIHNSFLVARSRLSHICIWSKRMILLIYIFLVEWTRHSTICISRDCSTHLIITLTQAPTMTTRGVQLELINKHILCSLFLLLFFFFLLFLLMTSRCTVREKNRIAIKYIYTQKTRKKTMIDIRINQVSQSN